MLNKTYSILTHDVHPTSIERSNVELSSTLANIKAKLVASEDDAFISLLLFTYSDFRRRIKEDATSYYTQNLEVSGNATVFMRDKLNSDFVTDMLNASTAYDREEYSTLKSDLDKLGFLVYLLLKAVG